MNVFFLGLMLMGLGFISWSMMGIWAQVDYSADIALEQDPLPAIAAAVPALEPESAPETETEPAPEPDLVKTGKALYPRYPVAGEAIGSLTIPVLEQKLSIVQGTGVADLKKGVGHFIQSVLPGEEDNCVLSGHRETVFRKIGKLKIGDQLIVETSAGTFTYAVSGTRIVPADDKTVIVPTAHAVLTLTTCYPFDTPGYFPDRYIVSADLIIKGD